MLNQPRSLKRSLVMGLTVCAIAPATAAASPAIQGQAVAAGGGPGVSAQEFAPQSLTAPDQVDRGSQATKPQSLTAPDQVDRATRSTTPANPRVSALVRRTSPAPASADSGVDTGVLIALGGGGALLLAGGLGVAGRKRLQTGRRSQLA
jgi:hypothetical protein